MCSGRTGAVPGRNRVPGTGSGLKGYRFRSRLDGAVSGNRVLGTRGIEKVPGSGDSVPKVPKVTLFRRYTFVL